LFAQRFQCWRDLLADGTPVRLAAQPGFQQQGLGKRISGLRADLAVLPFAVFRFFSPQPTPPKKPPRRNLSVSPTHLQTQMSLSADSSVGPSNYEYLFLARSGARSHIDLEQLQKRRDQLRHVTRSVDQYVEMKSRLVGPEEKRESNVEPVAITSIYENRPVKMLNPRRKLRRHAYETFEVDNGSCADKSPCSDGDAVIQERTFVSNAFLTLKSSQESLLDEKRETMDGQVMPETREATDKRLKRVQMMLPTSPTHYVQPPTPDHPPPSAMQAERSIHERIRPLSQVKCQFCFLVCLSRGCYSARLTRPCPCP